MDPTAKIKLGGDFNQLYDNKIIEVTGLMPLVHTPTRLGAVLDRLYVSELLYEIIKIVKSTIKSDHKAIVATTSVPVINRSKSRTVVKYRKRTPNQHALILQEIQDIEFLNLKAETDPQESWGIFYADIKEHLDRIYPLRTVILTSSEPAFMTPEIKGLLRRTD